MKLDLTAVEGAAVLRHLRVTREGLKADKVHLESKLQAHIDQPTQGALLVLDAELAVLEGVIRKMWGMESGP